VIRNTVGLAQETYLRLKEAFLGTDVVVELFHARFPFGRRKQIEDDVLAKYGKGTDGKPENPLRPKKAILVATQVIEQSLDLDFDVMYSDVAPVDLVLQRAGRLHRHDRGNRGQPCLWLIAPAEKEGAPDFGPSEWVYARFVLLRSLIALRTCSVIALPDDLERLVEQIYGKEPLDTPEHYLTDLAESEQVMREQCGEQFLNATDVSIDGPDEDPLGQQSAELDEEDPAVNVKIQAATRDADPSIQLVLVYQLHGRDFLDPDGQEPFEETRAPDVAKMRRLLDNEVTISHAGCVRWYTQRPVPSGWKKCGLLRRHRIVRLDSDGCSLPASDFNLLFSNDLGVQFT
jgi:CRISPR-associated endonuclease/helicase Cas3